MTCDFYQAPLVKHSWKFQNLNEDIIALSPNFYRTSIYCYELHEVMRQLGILL